MSVAVVLEASHFWKQKYTATEYIYAGVSRLRVQNYFISIRRVIELNNEHI
jgi:hypothetical protein